MDKKVFFIKRLNDHVQYLSKMKGRLDGLNQFEPCNCQQCALGGWLYGEGLSEVKPYGAVMEDLFQALFIPHERFHQSSDEALCCQMAGDELGTRRALTEMHQLSNTLVMLLLKMDNISGKTDLLLSAECS
ncbi:CZB domain-containing protein [Thiothrix lacustris]|jgi:hypothetical protein|uniref:CZB domain-containing protein n=1 Tax=Thiothrix lacustris TaxID=525917 RepID=UPI00048E2ABF|nr:CZB domain-containing protein [Thiothrix lacustris]